jgi:hypothetical protein
MLTGFEVGASAAAHAEPAITTPVVRRMAEPSSLAVEAHGLMKDLGFVGAERLDALRRRRDSPSR